MDKELEVSYRGVLDSEEPRYSPSPPMSPFEQMSEQQSNPPPVKQKDDTGIKINPSHYKQGNIEVIDFILDQKMDYLTSNICKYICRWRFKDGVCDLKKARWFLDKLIEQQEDGGGSNPE